MRKVRVFVNTKRFGSHRYRSSFHRGNFAGSLITLYAVIARVRNSQRALNPCTLILRVESPKLALFNKFSLSWQILLFAKYPAERKPCYELRESKVIPRFGETRFPSRPREAMMRGVSSNRPNYALGINCWRITFTNPIHPVIKLACRNAARVRWSANASRTPVHVANLFLLFFLRVLHRCLGVVRENGQRRVVDAAARFLLHRSFFSLTSWILTYRRISDLSIRLAIQTSAKYLLNIFQIP